MWLELVGGEHFSEEGHLILGQCKIRNSVAGRKDEDGYSRARKQ